MEIICLPRQAGKTKKLIEMCHPHDDYIVVPDRRQVEHVFKMAQDMGIDIRFPLTWDEAVRSHGMAFRPNFLVDNMDMIIQRLTPQNIKVITMRDR